MPVKTARQKYLEACLQTNVPAGLRVLKNDKSAFAKRVKRRFISKAEKKRQPTSSAFVNEVIRIYREYYRSALVQEAKRDTLEKTLLHELQQCLGMSGNITWSKLEASLKKKLRRHGYFALVGKVAPFRSLLVWKKQKPKTFIVPLTTHRQKVKVVLLDQFVELGWMHFATFGKYYVGGWAKKDALYCVTQAYKHNFNGERFRVSYLGHEAQHLADLRKFPKIKSHELEYRAKLAELAASRSPKKLAARFFTEARNDPKLPHCYASYLLKRGLGKPNSSKAIRNRAEILLSESARTLHVDQPKD